MESLAQALRRQADAQKNESDRKDFESSYDRTLALAGGLRQWLSQDLERSVYWVERTGSREVAWIGLLLLPHPFTSAKCSERTLPSEMIKSVVMTAATLATGPDDNFAFYRSRIGLSGGMSLRLGVHLIISCRLSWSFCVAPDPSRKAAV